MKLFQECYLPDSHKKEKCPTCKLKVVTSANLGLFLRYTGHPLKEEECFIKIIHEFQKKLAITILLFGYRFPIQRDCQKLVKNFLEGG